MHRIVTPHLVPCRHPQIDHWESVSEYNGLGNGSLWTEYILTGGAARQHGFLFYVGPDGKSVREFGGAMLPGPHLTLIEVARSPLFHRPQLGDLVPDETQELAPDDILVLNGQPMRLWLDEEHQYRYSWASWDHFGNPLTVKGL